MFEDSEALGASEDWLFVAFAGSATRRIVATEPQYTMAAVKEPVELAWSMKYLEFLIGPASEALGAGNHQPLYVVVTAGVNEVDGTEFWDIRHQVTELVV